MSGEIDTIGPGTSKTVYSLIFQTSTGKVWNGAAFETFTNVNYATYPVSLTEQGSSNIYVGNFPAAIPAGTYGVVGVQQITGGPLQSDPKIGNGNIEWNGSAPAPLSDTVTSGLLSYFLPTRLARRQMVKNFPVYLRSSADHISPFTSGVVSGQIGRDNGAFGPLQSGLFSEVGQGFYVVQALTSGDLDGATARLLFTAIGVSGGSSDPLPMGLVLQPESGG